MAEWQLVMWIVLFGILLLFTTGTPVAFSFGVLNIVCLYLFCGGIPALKLMSFSAYSSIANFILIAIPAFVLLGDFVMVSGTANKAFSSIDMLMGRIPGRLAVLTIINAMLFGAVSGSSMACNVVIGKTMIPELLKRGYSKFIAIGSVMGGAALDILIPPSVVAVIYASLADVSVGRLLIAGTVPGIIIGLMFIAYVVIVAIIRPHTAPRYSVENISTAKKIRSSIGILPLGFLFLLTMGLIYLGICTASEAAAVGAGGAFLLAFLSKTLKWSDLKESMMGTARVCSMVFLIIIGSKAFGQVIAYTGITNHLITIITTLGVSPWLVIIGMQLLVIIMGCLMDQMSIIYITVPVFMPIIKTLGFDPMWWSILMMINLETGNLTPPFGMNLFVTKSIVPDSITMRDIYKSAIPFCIMHIIGIALGMVFPNLYVWLPNQMTR